MGKGKIAAQVGHAAVKATLQSGEHRPELLDAWLSTGQKKVCVKADDVRQHGGREHLFRSYVMGLCWVMKYYYEGCKSLMSIFCYYDHYLLL